MTLREHKTLSKQIFDLQRDLKDLKKSIDRVEIMRDIINIRTEIEIFESGLEETIKLLLKK